MSNRTIERAVARKLYADFAKAWRREKRLAGRYGQTGYRRPTFSQWYEMHQRDQEMMAASSPQDVLEYLGQDPWAELEPERTPQEIHDGLSESERGIVEIPMMGEKVD